MLKRLLSTTVTIAFLVSGATIALEALGVLFQPGSADSERQRAEAFIARIEARFDQTSPVEPASPVDLPSTPEAKLLRHAAGRPAPVDSAASVVAATPVDAAMKQEVPSGAPAAVEIRRPAPQPEPEVEIEKPAPAAKAEDAPPPPLEAPAPTVAAAGSAPVLAMPPKPAPAAEPLAPATTGSAPAEPQKPAPAPSERMAAAPGMAAETRRAPKCTGGRCARPVAAYRSRRVARPARRRPPRTAGLFHCPLLGWLQ